MQSCVKVAGDGRRSPAHHEAGPVHEFHHHRSRNQPAPDLPRDKPAKSLRSRSGVQRMSQDEAKRREQIQGIITDQKPTENDYYG